MRRRDFIAFLGGVAGNWPLAARAQQPAMRVIGFLNGESADLSKSIVRAFQRGLRDIGSSRAAASRSNIAGPSANTTDYRRSRPIWFAAKWP
jgi:hypothetical protein